MTRIADLLRAGRTLSFEFFPPKTDEAALALRDTIAELDELHPSFVSVTYGAGGSNPERSIAVVEHMATQVATIGHLTCVGASSEGSLKLIRRFEDAGVEAILALRGDSPKDNPEALETGELKTAAELVAIASQNTHIGVGVAAFPEGHPESKNFQQDIDVLKLKQDLGATFAITQLFFYLEDYLKLVESARTNGIEMQILPGIMAFSSAKQVLRMAQMSNARVPSELLFALESCQDEDEARQVGMDYSIELGRSLLAAGAPGLHIFCLNQSKAAMDLAKGVGLA